MYSVRVTNLNDFDIKDFFDGVPYVIASNGECEMPVDAAQHIFGIPFEGAIDRDAIFLHLQRRWGWNRTRKKEDTEWIDPKVKFENLEFDMVQMSLTKKVVDIKEVQLEAPRPGLNNLKKKGKSADGEQMDGAA